MFAELLDASGPNEFTGYSEAVSTGHVVALLDNTDSVPRAEHGRRVDVVLDRTPFYAESGGQVGDTGTIETADGTLRVLETVYAVPGKLILHRAEVVSGHIALGSEATARIDALYYVVCEPSGQHCFTNSATEFERLKARRPADTH